MSRYTPLHVHSHYSLLNALPKIPALVSHAKKSGCTAIALTDNGNLYGALEFYKECKKEGLKPLLGMHAYLAIRSRTDKQAGVDNRRHRLLLIAENLEGYHNLIELSTTAHLEGFYYKPRIDRELLEKHHGGLIAIAPAFDSDIRHLLQRNDEEKLRERIEWYRSKFGADSFFLEISHHPEIPGHEEAMQELVAFSKKVAVPLVASHEIYYLLPEEKRARETLLLVNSNEGGSAREQDESDFSFVDPKEIEKRFVDLPEALKNNERIAKRCNLLLELGKWIFPDYKTESGASYDDELRAMTYEGLKRRRIEKTKEVEERIEYELRVIKGKGYAPYFLVVADLLRFAHEQGILTTIRGSVAGSLVTYLAGITNVNPLLYRLPFERFLNPERPSAPDIDMDYADNRRDEMIEYAKKKYGADRVAQIGTFGTMMARGSVRDVARALGFGYTTGDRIAKLIPMGSQGFPMSIERALELVPELATLYKEDADTKQIIDTARKIEGCARHISVHAAGVVIAPKPLTEYTPLQYDPKGGKLITQYDMYSITDEYGGVGLLKFDFLGIRNLAILADAVTRVKKIEGVDIDIENVAVDDKRTFEMLALGETGGLFQLNGAGMTRYLKELKPTTIHDINAMVALYRPGPMENIPQYIERKHRPGLVQYLDPRLKEILADSYGVITYQDDVLLIAVKLAGYSWPEADKLRKAMGKKIPAEMEAQKEKLTRGFIKNGMDKEKAEKLWKLIEPFAAYGFNKCLSGNTRITDAMTGKTHTIREMYESNIHREVYTFDSALKITHAPASAVVENGVKKVFTVTTRSGRTIVATDNHPFLVFGTWKELKNVRVGEKIAVTRYTPPPVLLSTIEHYKIATLGYLISEGNLCHPHGIYFYSAREDEVEDFVLYARQFENSKISYDRTKSATSVYVGQMDRKNGNSLGHWITSLGLRNKKATEKFVPDVVNTLDDKDISLFLGKLWQGDGCISIVNEQVYYATSSRKLAFDVQHLLLRLEIISTIHTKQFTYRGGKKTGYTVVISHRNNIRFFAKTVGMHLVGKKREAIEKFNAQLETLMSTNDLAFGTKDTVPARILALIRMTMSENKIGVGAMAQQTGLSERLFSYDKRKVGYQREVVTQIGKSMSNQSIINYGASDVYWDEVVSITRAGSEMTYDLTVMPHHNFVANDIIVHNSHAASYGKVAYQTAYMKANFPAIYMSSVLTAESGDVEKIGEIIHECKRMGIAVLPPSINESYSGFTMVKTQPTTDNRQPTTGAKDRIRFGLTTIKNFGEGVADAIIKERKEKGPFTSLPNFLERIKDKNLNKKSLEALIKSGALDEYGERGQMLANVETLLDYNKEQVRSPANQSSLFGLMTDTSTLPTMKMRSGTEARTEEKLAWEKELLGLYISGHPLDKFRGVLEKREFTILRIKEEFKDGMIAVVGGIIEEHKPIITKKNDMMAFLRVADFSSSIEVVVFPKVYEEFKKLLSLESCVAIKGRYSTRNGTPSLIAEKVKELK